MIAGGTFPAGQRAGKSIVATVPPRDNPQYPKRAEPYPGACGHQAAGSFATGRIRRRRRSERTFPSYSTQPGNTASPEKEFRLCVS